MSLFKIKVTVRGVLATLLILELRGRIALASPPDNGGPATTPSTAPSAYTGPSVDLGSDPLWLKVRRSRALETAAMKSFDVRFVLTMRWLSPLDAADHARLAGEIQDVHLVEDGQKYWEQGSISWSNRDQTPSPDRSVVTLAFDGRYGWREDSSQGHLVLFGTREGLRAMLSPSPFDFLAVVSPEEVAARVSAGKSRVASVRRTEEAGGACVEAEEVMQPGGAHVFTTYSENAGYMPIHIRDFARDGFLEREDVVGSTKEVTAADGNSFFLPIEAHSRSFDRRSKDLASESIMKADAGSVKINQGVPPETFILHAAEGDRVLNVDSGHFYPLGTAVPSSTQPAMGDRD